MKKLMIAAAVACAAAFANAATADWTVNGIMLEGDADNWDGTTFASPEWKVYVFDSNGTGTSYSDMITALSGNDFSAVETALASNIGTGKTGAEGAFTIYGTEMVGNPEDFAKGYAVILNTASLAEGQGKAFVTSEYEAVVGGSSLAPMLLNNFGDEEYEGLIDATGANGRGVWYDIPAAAAPEPTSGLLLLLGVAGLALRRRRV